MKRCLVTGATGFVGRHALHSLVERGYDVIAVTSRAPIADCAGVRWIEADLLSPWSAAAVVRQAQATHLLHCAWYAEPPTFWNAPQNFTWLRASIALMEAFAAAGGRRVVTAGTCAEYDWDYGYCEEDRTPLRPRTPYGVCKKGLQEVQAALCAQADVSAAWGRIFLLYGPHEHPRRLVASVINSLLAGERALCTHGRQIRDVMHVHDAADALVALLDSAVQGPVNIASGAPVAIREIVSTIGRLASAGGSPEFGAVEPPADDPPLLAADTRRLRCEVGFRPRYQIGDGLEQTVDWWRERRCA
jgi:nucleoside-diphosphate-sugar epimerase